MFSFDLNSKDGKQGGMLLKKLPDRADLFRTLLGFGNDKAVWRAALLLVFAFSVLGVLADIKNTAKFGQFDLRNRVVGARVMLLGHNPYTYRWHPGEPTTLLDPFIGPVGSNSGVTVTPAVLSLHALFAGRHYRDQKFIWLFVQLALFGGIIWLAMARAETTEARAAVFLAGLMFSCSTFWRLHVDRGQVYVLYSFLAALYLSSFSWQAAYGGHLGGFVLGVLVCLQPQMAVLGVPLLIYRRWNYVLGSIVGVGVGFLIPMLISRTVWPDYMHAMMGYVQVPPGPVDAGLAPPPKFELPAEVEGISNMATYGKFGDTDTSLKSTLGYLHIPFSSRLFPALLVMGAAAWFINVYRLMRRGVPLDYCAARTLGLVLFISLVLPIRRGEYSNVILVPMILMIFSTRSKMSLIQTWEWAVLLGVWILSAPFPPWISAGFRGLEIGVAGLYAVWVWTFLASWTRPITNVGAAGSVRSDLGADG